MVLRRQRFQAEVSKGDDAQDSISLNWELDFGLYFENKRSIDFFYPNL